MTDSFKSLDLVLSATEDRLSTPCDFHNTTVAAFPCAVGDATDDNLHVRSALSVEDINDLPTDFERRTGNGGPSWFCVIA
uniref:Pheromone Phb3.2 B45 n=1 Tax=Coprinopsis cinerea TaxID=5346 RepID=Q6TMB2_COPCI|nr:pheromone precursor Phb3.2 B45 [Coprinopsis cinerea]